MVSEHVHMHSIQIVMSDLKCEYYHCQLDIMSSIVLLMDLKLSGSIGYYLPSLH